MTLPIAREFASLVEDVEVRERIFRLVETEFETTRAQLLEISGSRSIADRFTHFHSRIQRRESVLEQVGRAQVSLIREFRQTARHNDNPDSEPLLNSINCVAAGLGWTG